MLVQIIQFLLSLSLIVIIHEFGHFMFAKLFGCRVEKFYLFFDWKFSLLKTKPREGKTTYGIGWIPLGGYVKIAGMVDESMDKEQLKEAPKPYEYRSKKAWQRLLIIVGGVIMNFVLAAVIYICMAWVYGESYIKTSDVHSGFEFSGSALAIGFENGDKVISVDGKSVENSARLSEEILLSSSRNVLIERDGKELTVTVTDEHIKGLLEEGIFISPRVPFIIDQVSSAANSEVLMQGDSLTSVFGEELYFADDFRAAFASHPSDSVTIGFVRDGVAMTADVYVDDNGKLGVHTLPLNIYPVTEKHYSFWQAIPVGLGQGVDKVASYFDQLGLIFSPETEAYKSVGGFITMGKIFPSGWDWRAFWSITALLSIMIGALNIMPIPALDGGHLLFILYEMITGRTPSDKFMEVAQIIGFVLIIGLVILANGNDIIKLF